MICYDLVLCLASICVFSLYLINDSQSNSATILGDMIIGCFFGFTLLSLAFLTINLSLGLMSVLSEIKKLKSKNGSINCVKLLLVPFEPGGLTASVI